MRNNNNNNKGNTMRFNDYITVVGEGGHTTVAKCTDKYGRAHWCVGTELRDKDGMFFEATPSRVYGSPIEAHNTYEKCVSAVASYMGRYGTASE